MTVRYLDQAQSQIEIISRENQANNCGGEAVACKDFFSCMLSCIYWSSPMGGIMCCDAEQMLSLTPSAPSCLLNASLIRSPRFQHPPVTSAHLEGLWCRLSHAFTRWKGDDESLDTRSLHARSFLACSRSRPLAFTRVVCGLLLCPLAKLLMDIECRVEPSSSDCACLRSLKIEAHTAKWDYYVFIHVISSPSLLLHHLRN